MPTDRVFMKQAMSGHISSTGALQPIQASAEFSEETFTFDVDADATLVERGFRVMKPFRLKSAYFTGATALAANASNLITMTVGKRDGVGGGAVTAATQHTNTTGGVSISAFVPVLLPLSATDANLTFAAGNVLTVTSVKTGTPTAPIGAFSVTVEYI